MDAQFQSLPPLKRFRLIQQKQDSTASDNASSYLPAKKRKESRDLPDVPASRTYSLPTKKRVWAMNPEWMYGNPLSPLDLNVEYKEDAEDEKRNTAPANIHKKGGADYGEDDKENLMPFLSIGEGNLDEIPIIKDADADANKETEIRSVKGQAESIKPEEEEDDSLSIREGDRADTPIVTGPGVEIRFAKKDDESIEAEEEEDEWPSIGEGDREDIPIVKESEADPETEIRSVKEQDDSIEAEEDEDDGILCAICQSTDGDPSDPIVFCDGCDLMVHATCYGNPLVKGIPEGDWFCAQCLASKSSPSNKKEKTFSCCLCPNLGGALKPTYNNQWAHVLCAVYVPEVFFLDPVGKEQIDLSMVPKKRWEEKCYICKRRSGCVIECSEPKCPLWFHVTCGLNQDLAIEYKEGNRGAVVAGFCDSHTELWKKQQQTGKFKIVARPEMRTKGNQVWCKDKIF